MTDNLIDNQGGNTMDLALWRAFSVEKSGVGPPHEARIASAYFSLKGLNQILPVLANIRMARILLGVERAIETRFKPRPLGKTERSHQAELLAEGAERLQRSLEHERDQLPFSAETNALIRSLIKILEGGNIEVRRYKRAFLHAKAYIAGGNSEDNSDRLEVLVGSSNLTPAGLSRNLELNMRRGDQQTLKAAIAWFDKLWEEAVPLDLAELYRGVLELHDPWMIYLRVLWQIYGDEPQDKDGQDIYGLTEFQKHGVVRALRLIEENGGAIVADEVGLGKTFIAGDILSIYSNRGHRSLILCPAFLRDSTWKDFLDQKRIYCECHSFQELSRDKQFFQGGRKRLRNDKDEYQLIIIDEAHNYRNPDTGRARVLRELLSGRPKDLLLLTATPVNNSLWDLYTLLSYFVRQDSKFAERGIVSIRGRFRRAASQDPVALNPDLLYPIIDATTVKRTRQFVKKHHSNSFIKVNGKRQRIVFPDPVPITVRYDLDTTSPGLMDSVFAALSPEGGTLTFARYLVPAYKFKKTASDAREAAHAEAGVHLLRYSLLKRFESSKEAFQITLQRMRRQCQACLEILEQKNQLATSKFHQEYDDAELETLADDEKALEDMNKEGELLPVKGFNVKKWRADLKKDLGILGELIEKTKAITHDKDAKLTALRAELEQIVQEAESEARDDESEQRNKRKLLIFSFFADTVDWVYEWLEQEVANNPKLGVLWPRFAKVSGDSDRVRGADGKATRDEIIQEFAPVSMRAPNPQDNDNYDVLITTDVLAEGVNLQQCRHIVNYDLPWNPMRLVQRHGRIDRIGSTHKKVFLRSVFPDKQLNQFLKLEERILDKLRLAAATVGSSQPVKGGPSGDQVFAENLEEREKIRLENPEIFRRGSTESAAQSGEEYRQVLRETAEAGLREKIEKLPWRAGSGMRKGKERGVFFSVYIGKESRLCFVQADEVKRNDRNWCPKQGEDGEYAVNLEIGTCLRLIEAEPETPKEDLIAEERLYDFWEVALEHFYKDWQEKTDPRNLMPKLDKVNREVIELLETTRVREIPGERVEKTINVLMGVWGPRDKADLRERFQAEYPSPEAKVQALVDWINDESGLPPTDPPEPYPPITKDDIKLLCWMAIAPE